MPNIAGYQVSAIQRRFKEEQKETMCRLLTRIEISPPTDMLAVKGYPLTKNRSDVIVTGLGRKPEIFADYSGTRSHMATGEDDR